ncbi:hypothetical protein HMPREF9467_00075, partial [, partial [[Clostridium] clostridioforme 2_1_49FAA]
MMLQILCMTAPTATLFFLLAVVYGYNKYVKSVPGS